MIDKNNYEAFVLDYLEGNLTTDQHNKLFAFLEAHPELEVDLDLDISAGSLPLEKFSFEDKSTLLRMEPGGERSIQEQLIALVEGDLDTEEVSELELLLNSSDNLEKERALFTISKLRGESVVYPYKALLLDEEPTKQDMLWAGAFEGDTFTIHISAAEKASLRMNEGSAVYPDKAALKKSIVVPLFVYARYAAVAAAIVAAFFLFPFDDSAPANGYQPYVNSGFPEVRVASSNEEQELENAVVNNEQQIEIKTPVRFASQSNDNLERSAIKVPLRLDGQPTRPIVTFAAIERDLLKEAIDPQNNQTLPLAPPNALTEPATLLASATEDYVPLSKFVKGKVFNKLNLPDNASATESFSTLASRASERLTKKTNNKLQIEAEKRVDKKRKYTFRIGDLLIRRD